MTLSTLVKQEKRSNFKKALSLLVFAKERNRRAAKAAEEWHIDPSAGIDQLQKIRLGDSEQWMLCRGHNRNAPLLLFLQGGIDCPAFINVPLVGFKTELEKHFVVVYWERRGVGKSRPGTDPESVTVQQTVEDLLELTRHLLHRFNQEKLLLVGHSWGSAMGMLAASRHPELYHAFVASGQVIEPLNDRSINYYYALNKAQQDQHPEALQQLEAIGAPPYNYAEHLAHLRWTAWSRGFGYALGNRSRDGDSQGTPWQRWRSWAQGLPPLLHASPYYTTRDIYNITSEPEWTMQAIGDNFYWLNLFEQAPRIEIPVFFCQARHEFITPPEILERYVQDLVAPAGKQIFWFDNNAHAVYIREPKRFAEIILDVAAKTALAPEMQCVG